MSLSDSQSLVVISPSIPEEEEKKNGGRSKNIMDQSHSSGVGDQQLGTQSPSCELLQLLFNRQILGFLGRNFIKKQHKNPDFIF